MSLKTWFFGNPPPKSEVREVHDKLVTAVAEHRESVAAFQEAADELLHKIDVESRWHRRYDKKKLDGDETAN